MSPGKVDTGRTPRGARSLLATFATLLMGLSSGGKADVALYDVYTRGPDGNGLVDILVLSREPYTGEKLVLMLGGEVKAPVVVDEHRRAIKISATSESAQRISVHHPRNITLDEWQKDGLKVVYGDITGDLYQDMLIVGAKDGNSYTLTWQERREQLIVQQVIDDEKLKFYVSEGYDIGLKDMNADAMDDLVVSKDGEVADIILVSEHGIFFARDTTAEASETTAEIAVNALLDAADRGDMASVLQLTGREAGHHLQATRDTLGDQAFLEELAKVEYAVPGRVGVNFAQYELAVRAKDGTLEFFPLTMERSRNGLWKIEGL